MKVEVRRLGLGVLFATFISSPSVAEEGMYRLDRLPFAQLKARGLVLSAKKLEQLSQAVVQVAGMGSGAFVSSQGLLVTNHHVAYGCLARLNAKETHKGLMRRGFIAARMKDELVCPGYDLLVIESVVDVTEEILKGIPDGDKDNFRRRDRSIRKRRHQAQQACQKTGRYCEVNALNGGTAFLRTTYKRIRDVRLVYAPPKGIGKYGGDIDNWIYPRHTGDFTFLRAYVAPSSEGRAYHKSNVPMTTPIHLRPTLRGVKRGDLTMVVGFPGTTARHVSSHSVAFYKNVVVPAAMRVLRGVLGVLESQMQKTSQARRRYEGLEASLRNSQKYYRMAQAGFVAVDLLASKRRHEQRLIRSHPNARGLLTEIQRVYRRYRSFYPKLNMLRRLTTWGVPSLRTVYDLVRWQEEKRLPQWDRRDERYWDSRAYRLFDGAKRLERETAYATEVALLRFFLGQAARTRTQTPLKLLEDSVPRPGALPDLFKHSSVVGYGKTESNLAQIVERRDRLFRGTTKDFRKAAENDPLLKFAKAIEAEYKPLRDGPYQWIEGYYDSVLHPKWVSSAVRPAYPDANFTVRLSYGSVADYTATRNGKTYRFVTTLEGLLRKDRRRFPFNATAVLRKAARMRRKSPAWDRVLGDIPVNFTATLDTTGGNSGSPVLNRWGEVVGLLFDGTPESILSDWTYREAEQRSICVDFRFVYFVARASGATRVLKELGLPADRTRRAK